MGLYRFLVLALVATICLQSCHAQGEKCLDITCSADESCCKDSTGSECCTIQSTYCVQPRGDFGTSTCCGRWEVGCTVGSVGCCDPATPWQYFDSHEDMRSRKSRPTAQNAESDFVAESTAYALFPEQLMGNSWKIMTIDTASGNTTKNIVSGPAASYYAHYYGESTRVFPFDSNNARFVFADNSLDDIGSPNSPMEIFTIEASGKSTSKSVVGCAGYPLGMAWDDTTSELVVGMESEKEVQFCSISPDTGAAKKLTSISRGSSENSPAFYAAYISSVQDSTAYRVGHKQVTTGQNVGLSEVSFQTKSINWTNVPRAVGHESPITIHRMSNGGDFVSLAPRTSDGGFDVVTWDAVSSKVVGNLTNAHAPSIPGLGGSLGYISDKVLGSTHYSMTVAQHNGIFPGIADKWTISMTDLTSGMVKMYPLTPQPSWEGAETESLSGFGVVQN